MQLKFGNQSDSQKLDKSRGHPMDRPHSVQETFGGNNDAMDSPSVRNATVAKKHLAVSLIAY